MKITFLGATKTVTGSNFLVEAAGKKFLVDCGMYQGRAELELENYNPFDYNPAEIDFMLLTHAHIDHSGRIPKLYNEGFQGPIYAHKATCDLCGIMLPDSGHIQEMESEWKNKKRIRKGEQPLLPLYTAEDAINCQEIFVPVKYDEIIQIDENINVRFNDAGHMLGSSIIEIWANEDGQETKAVFTGDIGNNDLPLLSVDSIYTDSTVQMINNFQKKYNLEETGITDRNTWNKILEVYQTTIKNIPTSYKEYINEIYPGRFLSLGMSGDDVKVLQNFLFKICSKFHTIPGVRVTGTFDELTERSIKVLENRFNHEVNGIVGPVTWQKIVDYSKEEI